MKEKILFIPPYIAPLKYFERFIPHLSGSYTIGFLFIGRDSARRKEMISYAEHKNHAFHILEEGLPDPRKKHIPFVTPLRERYVHAHACREFLKRVKPQKIIAHKSGYAFDTIYKEANKLGIETIVLQWSSDASFVERFPAPKRILKRLYFFTVQMVSGLLDLFHKEPRYGFTPGVPKKIIVFTKAKADLYLHRGYAPDTIHVVGSPDFQLIRELKQKIDSDPIFKKRLLEKYGLKENKKKIVVILYRFYLSPPKEYKMTVEEHVEHYYYLFKTIRDVFPENTADIVLRMHPTENSMEEIYKPYEALGVQLSFGEEARTDELICLSDIYVGEPSTSVNNMVLASGIPAIFVNLSEFSALDKTGEHFNIDRIIKTESALKEALMNFKRGEMQKYYDNSHLDVSSVDKIVKLIG
ncbi:MAG: hypothetical protein HY455_03690 [Parcubacteria group bacterium]|nr:hypothetical protein [Parcubacteria group bacterium]